MIGDDEMMSDLRRIFYGEAHNICQKWEHYFDVYERYFSPYRGKRLRFLEIGVSQGGSLDMWKSYFGSRASIIGVDIDPACRRFAGPDVEIVIGDQGSPDFLKQLASHVGQVDIILDDGGHRVEQQILTFQHLYPILKDGGVYMCEDVHTSYDAHHGGGLKKPGTFIEFMKDKVDELHAWYVGGVSHDSICRHAHAISFYDSIVVVEKRSFDGPRYVEIGIPG